MMAVNSEHALHEFLENIRARDLIKARIVLQHYDAIGAREQKRILFELQKCPDSFAIPLLVFLAVQQERVLASYPSLREALLAKALESPKIVLANLKKKSAEQFFYAQLAGELRLREGVADLLDLLSNSMELPVIKAVLKALGEIGEPVAVDALIDFLHVEQGEVVCLAIRALGRIATPDVMRRLAARMGQDEELDMCILDVFALVHDDFSLRKLSETLRTRSTKLLNYCKGKLVGVGGKAVPLLSDNLFDKDVDFQIHTLNVLKDIGDAQAVQPIRKLLNTNPDDANVRFAAYEALASLPGRRGDYVLAAGLTDPEDNVRLAAARAIDRNLDDVLGIGIKNMLKRRDGEAVRIIKAVVDAQASRLFLFLLEDDFFHSMAEDYLATRAHGEIREFFVGLLLKEKQTELAERINRRAAADGRPAEARPRIAAIDDSRLILNIYRAILTELGFEPVLFEEPAKALAWLARERPLAVCTDLNMPEITGLMVIETLRRRYTAEDLPVVLVTTQQDEQAWEDARQAGANVVMAKPFDAEKLKEALSRIDNLRSWLA